MRRASVVLLLLALSTVLAAQTSTPTKSAKSDTVAPVDRAYLQSIWDGWASADIEKQGRFYVQGPGHLFFDVAPLKYNSWQEYHDGVAPSLKDSPKVTYTLNDDLQIHPAGTVHMGDRNTRHGRHFATGRSAEVDVALDRRAGAAGRQMADHPRTRVGCGGTAGTIEISRRGSSIGVEHAFRRAVPAQNVGTL